MEAGSVSLYSYEPLLIPDLLQTEGYIRALFSNLQPPDAIAEDAAAFRLERHKILTVQHAPTVHAVLHEAALRMHHGGPKVMKAQLLHLIELARLPNVVIQVIPFRSRTFPGVSAPFLYAAPQVEALATVVLEHPDGPIYRDAPVQLSQYRALFDALQKSALAPIAPSVTPGCLAGPQTTLQLLQHLLYDL